MKIKEHTIPTVDRENRVLFLGVEGRLLKSLFVVRVSFISLKNRLWIYIQNYYFR